MALANSIQLQQGSASQSVYLLQANNCFCNKNIPCPCCSLYKIKRQMRLIRQHV
jgi:hypothetical protein